MSTTASLSPLAVSPEPQYFRAGDRRSNEASLRVTLLHHHHQTLRPTIGRPEDLQLHDNLQLQGRYRLTKAALAYLCRQLAPGLAALVFFAAGLREADESLDDTEDEQPEIQDNAWAISLVNQAIRLRFRRLRGCRLVIDQTSRRVEGIVGRKYAFLSNAEAYRDVSRFFRERGDELGFHDAVLVGRRLMLRFRALQPLFYLPARSGYADEAEPIYLGYHLANSEIGECSVRVAPLLLREQANQKFVLPCSEGGKVAHVRGPQFRRRFLEGLEKARQQAEQLTDCLSQLQRTRCQSLSLGVSQSQHTRRLSQLQRWLMRRGLTRGQAETVMGRVVVDGDRRGQRAGRSWEALKQRSVFDLACALSEQAKQHRPGSQEKLEVLASQVLLGKCEIPQ